MKKPFLYSLILSVCLSAFLGILAILSGSWGWFEIRILLTTVAISGASICGLACGAYLGAGKGRTLPSAGIILALLGAAMVIAGMWVDVRAEEYWKTAASMAVFAVACGHLALLSMARLAEGFQWSLKLAHGVILGVAGLIVVLIWSEFEEMGMFRLLGVAAIVDAAITIVIPIFHRLSKAQLALPEESSPGSDPDPIDAEIRRLKDRIAELERMRLRHHS